MGPTNSVLGIRDEFRAVALDDAASHGLSRKPSNYCKPNTSLTVKQPCQRGREGSIVSDHLQVFRHLMLIQDDDAVR